jgi:hypothetical protein
VLSSLARIQATDDAEYYRREYGALGEAWVFLSERLQPREVVATNYAELNLPLLGVPPRGRVVRLRVGERIYRWEQVAANREEWRQLLRLAGVRYLFLWRPKWYPQEAEKERQWVREQPAVFRPLGRWEDGDFGEIGLYAVENP